MTDLSSKWYFASSCLCYTGTGSVLFSQLEPTGRLPELEGNLKTQAVPGGTRFYKYTGYIQAPFE